MPRQHIQDETGATITRQWLYDTLDRWGLVIDMTGHRRVMDRYDDGSGIAQISYADMEYTLELRDRAMRNVLATAKCAEGQQVRALLDLIERVETGEFDLKL